MTKLLEQTDRDSERDRGGSIAVAWSCSYQNMLQAMAIVEGAATALSAPHMTADDLSAARRINDEAVDPQLPPPDFDEACARFHDTLLARCPNSYMRTLFDEEILLVRALRPPAQGSHHDRRATVDGHSRLLDLIEHDPHSDVIAHLVRSHRAVCR